MDAEFLTERGARVITSDVSLGAAKRAAERARRFGMAYLSIVSAAEQLPLADVSVDLAYVHDGLHHLAEPQLAFDEMSRVADRWVVVTEPARASSQPRLSTTETRKPRGAYCSSRSFNASEPTCSRPSAGNAAVLPSPAANTAS